MDGDLAANNGGWQWSASTGADAVPYFRVFNPLSQSRKFDPDGVFLREWLPELAHLPGDAIHDPSPMGARPPATGAHRGPGRQPAARAGSVRQSAARLNRRASRAGSRSKARQYRAARTRPCRAPKADYHITPRLAPRIYVLHNFQIS